MTRQIFIQEGTSRRKNRQTLENFYYEAIHCPAREQLARQDILNAQTTEGKESATVPRTPTIISSYTTMIKTKWKMKNRPYTTY